MNKLNLVWIAILFLLVGCEYDPVGEDFVKLTPPASEIPVAITLNDINPADTIYVYQNTTFSIKINSTNTLLKADVLIDNKVYANMSTNSLSFSLDPAQLPNGLHTLTVSANFSSGTGSLAEMMGMEGYKGNLSWHIRVISNSENSLTLGYRINKDGFMELYWDTVLPKSIINGFIIHSGLTQNADVSIGNPAQRTFVDYGYVCGNAYYNMTVYLKGGYTFNKTLSVSIPAPSNLYFEDLGLDKLRIFWHKPAANARFNLTCDGQVIASGMTDTTLTIPQLYGQTRSLNLEIRPQNAAYDNLYNKFSAWDWFTQGISLSIPNWPLYAYNRKDNIIYSTVYSNLVAFNANTMEKINSVSINGNPWGLIYGGKLASAPHNSTVAAMTGEETWIFPDSRFENPVRISPLPGDANTHLAAFTSNDRFFVVEENSNVCKVFNAITGLKIMEFPFTYKTIYTFPDFEFVSEDGRYFCACSESGIEIFEISGTVANVVYTDTRVYKGAMAIPSQPDKLLLRVGSDIEVRQMPGFTPVQRLDVSDKGALLCNIDPASMSLLYYQKDSLKVCKVSQLDKTIFKIRSNESTCKMYNNKLLTYGKGGICFDISPYLNK